MQGKSLILSYCCERAVNQKVIISKGKPHLYGEIVKIGRPGKIGEDFKEDRCAPSQHRLTARHRSTHTHTHSHLPK